MATRRELGRLLFGGLAASQLGLVPARAAGAGLPTRFGGVEMGVCLYNYRDMPRPADQEAYLGAMIDACVRSGVGLVELNSNYLEPANFLPFQGIPRIQDARPNINPANPPRWATVSREELLAERDRMRQWRLKTPVSYFSDAAARFRRAGLTPFSYVMTFTPDMTDAEMDAIFRHARALGVKVLSTNQTKVEMGPRLVPYAERYGFDLGFHNHTQTLNPNEVASLESFEKLFALSPRMKANLDVGHYVAANLDAVDFVRKHPTRITHLHMKDRKRNEGPNVRWGEGDAPIRDLLLMIRDQKLPIPCFVEYEYRGDRSSVEETQACLDFMKRVLA
jgi:sugar phosphate isomerase/epimerase